MYRTYISEQKKKKIPQIQTNAMLSGFDRVLFSFTIFKTYLLSYFTTLRIPKYDSGI